MSFKAINIDTLHANIKDVLSSQFPSATVDFYPRPGERISTPSILLELEDITINEEDDIGTEQTPVRLNFNAYCVMDYKTGKKQAVKVFASSVLHFIHRKRWGLPVSAAQASGATPDVIAGKEDDYEVMRVEFSHDALLGESRWIMTEEEKIAYPKPSKVYAQNQPAGSVDELTNCGCDAL